MGTSNIPTRVEDFNCNWLTESLRESGVLAHACVTEVEAEVLGGGEGFMGEIIRLRLEYDTPEPDAPATLIAKLPTHVPENHAIGELLGAYEREIVFYDELAPMVPLRTPRVYYSDMEEGGGSSERDAKGAAILDKWPMWVIRLLMILVTWIAKRRTRRYVLLIEDFGSDGAGCQIEGCTPEVAREILVSIAKVHAQNWRSPKLAESHWLRRSDLNPRTMHSVFLKNRPGFEHRFRDGAPEGFVEATAWLESRAVELLRDLYTTTPETLLHCDLRLDNLILPRGERSDEPIVFFDWQLVGRGPGAYDVAYFLSGALASDVAREVDLDLVRDYHGALVANGVDDYPLDDCIRDYRRGLLSVLHRVSSTDTMELGDGRGADLVALWLERTLARLRGVDFNALLEG